MGYAIDSLASKVERLVNEFSSGRKSISIKTGVDGDKLITVINTPDKA